MAGNIEGFIARWAGSGGQERANYVLFVGELCEALDLPRPRPAPADYCFEHPVTFVEADGTRSTGRIDLYKRDCFVLEAKQGTDAALEQLALFGGEDRKNGKGHGVRGSTAYIVAMNKARNQAERYAKWLPVAEGWPPFIVVVDVGHAIELFADFSRSGKSYAQFPDAQRFRIMLGDLRRPEVRERLRKVWTDPLSLDPAREAARVTREVAEHLAQLAKLLERREKDAGRVAQFLMRCLFTMFAEDIGLLPEHGFQRMLAEIVADERPDRFRQQAEHLWRTMDRGGFHPSFKNDLLRFNGGLFADAPALNLEIEEVGILLKAAKRDWRDVEPAIFGTLLERALEKEERHRLGAHFTPRAYVERLVVPTVIEPLRAEWAAAQGEALRAEATGERAKALAEVRAFHQKLCAVRVLDPACGTGNFLYVAMELMKRLEGEVIEAARALGETQDSLDLERHTVDPHQFLGIELNPRAASIAELVLWIGWLQWHFRTRGQIVPAQPVLKDFKNIECRDALLVGEPELVRDKGVPVTRWDGRTYKRHPVTGESVPDERARTAVYRYPNPMPAAWPEAEFIVGNPPYQAGKDFRDAFGAGHAEAMWKARPDVPGGADLVLHWWDQAATLVREGKALRFGFITTNSLRQTFNRRVIERHMGAKKPLSLLYAVPDHPWVDGTGNAAVRIAMTVGVAGDAPGLLRRVVAEKPQPGGESAVTLTGEPGKIMADLRLGADLGSAKPLLANEWLSSPGVKLHGAGFIVTPAEAEWLGLGRVPGLERHILPYRNGRDLNDRPRDVMVIDLFGLKEEDVRGRFPEVYQRVLERVKPEREHNSRSSYAERWWVFGEPRAELRRSLQGLRRYISTVETSKHRTFVFLDASIRPDNKLINFGLDDAFYLSVLSSRVHVAWSLAAGGRLGVGNDPVYVKTRCFDPFPFPDPDAGLKARLRELGEQLDAHRKARQAAHPGLTMTGMYNVLEKLRREEALTDKERAIHEQGLVSVLLDLHRRIDAAVLDAYGWPRELGDEAILERLVALNRARAREEHEGRVRWLRPEFQRPLATAARPRQEALAVEEGVAPAARAKWPKPGPERFLALTALLGRAAPLDLRTAVGSFDGAKPKQVDEVLRTLVALGQARALPQGRFAA